MRLLVDCVFVTAECSSNEELKVLNKILSFESSRVWGEDEPGMECLFRNDNTFYTGLLSFVETGLKEEGIEYTVEYENRVDFDPLSAYDVLTTLDVGILPGISLREYQYDAVLKMLVNRRGVVRIPTAGGKTEISQAAFRYLLDQDLVEKALYLVEARGLFKQAVSRFKERGFRVGAYSSSGLDDPDADVVVGMTPSLFSHLRSGKDPLRGYGAVIFDEAHHVAANRGTTLLENCPAVFRWGMSATPMKTMVGPSMVRDYKLIGLLGDVIFDVSASYLIERGYIARPVVTFLNVTRPDKFYSQDWRVIHRRGILDNDHFHKLVAAISYQMAALGHRVIVLVLELEHGEKILKALRTFYNYDAVMFSGDETLHEWNRNKLEEKRKSIDEVVTMFNSNSSFILVGTPAIGEGVNLPTASTVIPAFGGKDYKSTLQAVGRGMRPKIDENVVYVFDFVHFSNPALAKHSRERRETYLAMDYTVQDGLRPLIERGVNLELPR